MDGSSDLVGLRRGVPAPGAADYIHSFRIPPLSTDLASSKVSFAPLKARSATALILGFAALIAGCSLLPAIHLAGLPVPITLQTFAIMLTAACLGPVRGTIAVVLYLAAGLAGLPIFSGGAGGLEVLAKPSVGYLLSWPLAAALTGTLVQRIPRQRLRVEVPLIFLGGMAGSLLFIHPLGIAGMAWRLDLPAAKAFGLGLSFLPGDLVKNTAMALVAAGVHRAFPHLLARPLATGASRGAGASTASASLPR